MRAPRRALAATMLTLEAFVLLFAGLVAKDLAPVSSGTALALCLGLAFACLVTAGLLRRPGGYAIGWVLQAATVATGLLVPVMFFVGAVFAGLWAVALHQGARIERERAEHARRQGPGGQGSGGQGSGGQGSGGQEA